MIPIADIINNALRVAAEWLGIKRLQAEEHVEGRSKRALEQEARKRHEETIKTADQAVAGGDVDAVNNLADSLLDDKAARDSKRPSDPKDNA